MKNPGFGLAVVSNDYRTVWALFVLEDYIRRVDVETVLPFGAWVLDHYTIDLAPDRRLAYDALRITEQAVTPTPTAFLQLLRRWSPNPWHYREQTFATWWRLPYRPPTVSYDTRYHPTYGPIIIRANLDPEPFPEGYIASFSARNRDAQREAIAYVRADGTCTDWLKGRAPAPPLVHAPLPTLQIVEQQRPSNGYHPPALAVTADASDPLPSLVSVTAPLAEMAKPIAVQAAAPLVGATQTISPARSAPQRHRQGHPPRKRRP